MGKLEDALERANQRGGGSSTGGGGGGGLGAAVGGGARLQSGNRGASLEEQVAGKMSGGEEKTRERVRETPTSPRGTGSIGAAEG